MNTAIDLRQSRGIEIAKAKSHRIRQLTDQSWLVPSQTNASGGYVVSLADGTPSCSCPDFEERRLRCKHLWAIAYFRRELTLPDGTTLVTEERITYSQNWPAYNAAQRGERSRVQLLLKGLCDGIVQPTRTTTRGRKPARLGDVVYAAAMKVYGTLSARLSEDEIVKCEERKLIGKAPAYNTLLKYAEQPELEPLLKVLIQEAAMPLRALEKSYAIDSSGFAFNAYSRWFDAKYGTEKRSQRWLKVHAQVGLATDVITAVEVTEAHVGDATMMRPLLDATVAAGFTVSEMAMDKAYLSNDILTAVEAVGGVPYVPFKSNSRPTGESEAWRRLWHMFESRNEEFLERYHKRSRIEAVFSSIKRRWGAHVRSKLAASARNEILLKCLVHNLSCVVHAIHEVGIEPAFWNRLGAGV